MKHGVRRDALLWPPRHNSNMTDLPSSPGPRNGYTGLVKCDTAAQAPLTLALFPEDRLLPAEVAQGIQLRLSAFEVARPRQWGACWLALWLWELLELGQFWGEHLPISREGTRWDLLLAALTAYRLIEPGSEWRLHRPWYGTAALGDLLGPSFSLGGKDNLYGCLDQLLEHKSKLFTHLRQRWVDLFGAKFEVLLSDLSSSYFESDPPFEDGDKRRHGYSRDHRPDCVQVVLAPSLHATLRGKLRPLAPGLTPKAVLEKLAAIEIGARQNRRKMSRWSRRRVW